MKEIGRKRKAETGLVCSTGARDFLFLFFWLQRMELSIEWKREREKSLGFSGPKQEKRKKKGLLVIIKSSPTDFLPNLFPWGP